MKHVEMLSGASRTVIVIGAGFAGLAAARDLQAHGVQVTPYMTWETIW